MIKVLLSLAVLAILGLVGKKLIRYKTLYPFLPRKYNFAKRRGTLRRTLELLDQRRGNTLVETGVARHGLRATRSDGASTIVFGLWAGRNNARLHSVDIDPDAVETAREELRDQQLEDCVSLYVSDSVQFLEKFDEAVDFLYLDSFDYDVRDPDQQRQSQEHHLKEFRAIENRLHDNSIVLIDDCRRPGGGKGKLVIAYMLERGWKVAMNEFQVLLLRSATNRDQDT